ncbi:MAG: 3-keto-5-aminohexanoate cleavage protein [Steroidobacteraceae bacterium]|jgi:uncharacterized protein (DUF849 family)
MYFTDDSLLPENQQPLMITVAPYGPEWLPADYPEDIPVSWEQQVQKAVDCFEAGATVIHLHVRVPETGHGSKDLDDYNKQIERIRKAVPDLIIQVGGSISFAPKTAGAKAEWLSFDTRHMLAELTPKPDQVTVAIDTCLMDFTQLATAEDIAGTSLTNPQMLAAYANLYSDSPPSFYIEHLKRLRKTGIQPMFMLANLSHLETVERLIRSGAYMGPLVHNLAALGGGGIGRNPADWIEYTRRSPHGSILTWEGVMRSVYPMAAMAVSLGVHMRVGIEDTLCGPQKGKRMTSIEQIKWVKDVANKLNRPIATAKQARQMLKLGTWYNSVDETLSALGLPPNREGGQQGFIVHKTDGKIFENEAGLHPVML